MKGTGVYEILNTVNGKRYIGSAISFKNRQYSHLSKLRKGQHHSPKLQAAWNKYGPDAFVFRPILRCSVNNRLMYEQLALAVLKPFYNISLVAGAPMSGRRHSLESRQRISKANTGTTWGSHTPEAKLKMSEAAQKRGPVSDSTREKISIANRRRKGEKRSDKAKENISAAARKRPRIKQTPEHIAKRAAHRIGKPLSAITRQRISKTKTGVPRTRRAQ